MDTPEIKLEALLFIAGEAVAKRELEKLLELPPEGLAQTVQTLREALVGRGLALVETSEEVQLVTAPAVADFLRQFTEEENSLSKAALETLAIIAYRGPVSRYDVDVVRGVDSRRMIRQLVRHGLITKLRGAGRTPLYDISGDFLARAGIQQKTELPAFAELSSNEKLQALLENK